MEKKVYVKRYPRENGRREENSHDRERRHEHRRDEYRGDRPRSKRPERQRHDQHMHWDFFDGKPGGPGRPGRPFDDRHFRKMRKHMKTQITKMFTDKLEMVTYVNTEGEKGHNIDVYKIEDELYKVVVTKKPDFEKLFAQEEEPEEVEIEEE